MNILFVIRNIGDYHAARLARLARDLANAGHELSIIEISGASSFYRHRQTRSSRLVGELKVLRAPERSTIGKMIYVSSTIAQLKPEVVIQIGFNDPFSITSLVTAKIIGAKLIFLADSKEDDTPRLWIREVVKKLIVPRFHGALVAGERHKKYFAGLGLEPSKIETGYDVVDNGFFELRARQFRRKRSLIKRYRIVPERYILVVSRLVGRKRVPLTLEIYAASALPNAGVSMVLIGDGPCRDLVATKIKDLGVQKLVHWRSEVPNSKMPLFYGLADAMVLLSEYDQWGLSVNEGMATGLPVLVTSRTGCADEIVLSGHNGYVWRDSKLETAIGFLETMVLDAEIRRALSDAALATMREWDLERFSSRLSKLASNVTQKSTAQD